MLYVLASSCASRRPTITTCAGEVEAQTARHRARLLATRCAIAQEVRPGTSARRRRARARRSYVLVDACLYAGNPGLIALAETHRLASAAEDLLLVSLGAGDETRAFPFEQVHDWGRLEWSEALLTITLDSAAAVTDMVLEPLLPRRSYVRLQPRLEMASDDIDDASPENLTSLSSEAERLIAQRSSDIDAICAQLTDR